jgi:putative oxygen-independent coproporphyrinogen III oxidase
LASFGIYVHWPFCRSKCPYCDFNSHVRERIDEAAWRDALVQAIDRQAARTRGRTVDSVFFGGGTPSLMDPRTTAAVLERIARRWDLSPDAEITLEANPTSAEAESFAGFRAAGVNRLSLGVQALDAASLKFLGRQHDAKEARAAIALAARHFQRYSFDLIYARPGQTLAAWRAELADAVAMAADHLSVYQLTIEQGTAFHAAHARGDFVLPDEDLADDLFDATQADLAAMGLPAYEISNHARPGSESRHNKVYWRYGDYVGVGPGAHGRLTLEGEKLATRQIKAPELWLANLQEGGDGMAEEVPTPREDRLTEMLMMGLRLVEGIPRSRFLREAGGQPEAVLDPRGLADLIEDGFVTLDDARLMATAKGRPVLNAVLAKLL